MISFKYWQTPTNQIRYPLTKRKYGKNTTAIKANTDKQLRYSINQSNKIFHSYVVIFLDIELHMKIIVFLAQTCKKR